MTLEIVPIRALSLLAREAVRRAEQQYHDDDTYEACQLLMATRTFLQAIEVFIIYREGSGTSKRG